MYNVLNNFALSLSPNTMSTLSNVFQNIWEENDGIRTQGIGTESRDIQKGRGDKQSHKKHIHILYLGNNNSNICCLLTVDFCYCQTSMEVIKRITKYGEKMLHSWQRRSVHKVYIKGTFRM